MITYNQYLAECNTDDTLLFTGKKNKKNKPIKEKRFNQTRDFISKEITSGNYSSRVEAEADLELKVQKMDPITFFLFRALIGWLIGKLLDNYFDLRDKQV